MNKKVTELLNKPATTIEEAQSNLMRVVHAVLGTADVRPGFQFEPAFVEFAKSQSFPIGVAINGFIKRTSKNMLRSELHKQRRIVENLTREILKRASSDELFAKCFDMSVLLSAMLEELGIWTLAYRGTLIFERDSTRIGHSLYYLEDVFNADHARKSNARGHSWVSCTPFAVVDLTARFQNIQELAEFVPAPVLIEGSEQMPIQEKWYFAKAETEEVKERKRAWLIQHQYPELNEVFRNQHLLGEVSLFYMPMDCYSFDKPLRSLETNLTIAGIPPFEFLQDFKNTNSELF